MRSKAILAFLLVLAIWCAANWMGTVHALTRFYVVLPVMDYWRVPYWLHDIETLNLQFLWVQHNEHRIVFPDLIFAADVWLLHGRRVLPVALSFLCYFGCWLLISGLWLRERDTDRVYALAAGLIAGTVIGWKGAALALADPFLIQWTLLSLAALVSLFAVTSIPHASPKGLTTSVLFAIVATYSSANGLILWPMLIAIGICLRFTKNQILFLVGSGIVAVGTYFIGYKSDGALHLTELLTHPLYAGMFVCAFLSMPFGAMKSPSFGVYVGLANILLAALLFWLSCRGRPSHLSRPLLASAAWYAFVLLSALLIALGRMDPSDSTLTAARALRYLPLVTVNWSVCLSLLVAFVGAARWRRFTPLVCVSVLAILLALGFFKLRFWFEKSGQLFSEQQLAELSVENGLMDSGLFAYIFPDRSFVANLLPVMKKANVSIYFQNPAQFLGRQVAEAAPHAVTLPASQITSVRRVESGTEVIGWNPTIAGRTILLVNSANRIIGSGRHLRNGLPWSLSPPEAAPQSTWAAFIPERFGNGPFRACLTQ